MSALASYIEAQKLRRFRWGSFDCCTFAFGGRAAVTGHNALDPVRGSYASRWGALKSISLRGGLRQAVTGLLARQPTGCACLEDGALSMVSTDAGHALAVAWDGRLWLPTAKRGVCEWPVSRVICSWGVD